MAVNKFATMLHRNTNRITVVLVYAVLEWILIILLFLNSLFSYLISKFTNYFGLKPPCLWCSRLDHVFDAGKHRASYRDLVCEIHASEISKLGYCTKHGKLAEAKDMCEDCSSSRHDSHGKTFDIGRKIALFSWVKQKSMISRNGEKQIENGDKSYICSCCDVSLDSKFYSPCLLYKPSWGVLDYAQKANLIASAIGADNDGDSDPSKSDCPTDEHEMERFRGANGDEIVYDDDDDDGGIEDEQHIPTDVDEDDQKREESEEDCSQCREMTGDDEEKTSTTGEVESIAEIQVCPRTDASADILPPRLENPGDMDDHRLVPLSLIDSMTAKNQIVSRCRKEDQKKPGKQVVLGSESLIETQFKLISTQFDFILERDNISEGVVTVPSADENTMSTKLESMGSVLHAEKRRDGDGFEAVAGKEPDYCPASEEAVSEMLGDVRSNVLAITQEPSDRPQAIELVPSLPCLQQDQSSKNHDDTRNSNHSYTLMVGSDQGPKQAEDVTVEDRSTHFDRAEHGINDHLSLCLEINEGDEEKAPESPNYMEGLHNLNQKILLPEKKEFGAEESLDGSVISELEGGDGVLTIERLKSALKAERKALNAMYAELEEERNASAIAANQTMAMITRLQEEKAAMQMEALQYQRMMEEQSDYDQEALQLLNEIMVKREKEKQEVEKELETYRQKVLHYEAKDQRMMRRKDSNGRSRTSSAYSSNAEDSEELSIDFNHEVRDEDGFYSHKESSNSNHYTPANVVLNLEDGGLECAKHLSTLNESLADFEEERLSILEQLKALEEKLFTLDDDHEEPFFEDRRPMEHILKQNGKELNENSDFNHREANGFANGFSDDLDVKHHQERRNMGAKGKRLLPLFDAIGTENEDSVLNGEQEEPNGVLPQNSLVSKFTQDNRRTAIEEEVDYLYERLQALEGDREFLKNCIGSLNKGGKGMDLLQQILQHLRDLRSVEMRARNMGDGALA